MHEHISCNHELKYCKVCDVVYCEKCKTEWVKSLIWTQQPYITYAGDSTVVAPTNSLGTDHNHTE